MTSDDDESLPAWHQNYVEWRRARLAEPPLPAREPIVETSPCGGYQMFISTHLFVDRMNSIVFPEGTLGSCHQGRRLGRELNSYESDQSLRVPEARLEDHPLPAGREPCGEE